MYTFDHDLFLALNFDGGPVGDALMSAVSGVPVWIPLYVLILCLVWCRTGWRGLALFVVLVAAAMGLADMVSGIFKANGLLGDLLPGFQPRWRPMFTPPLEGLSISPDSLRVLRQAGPDPRWAVHVPPGAVGGRYGTVSAHAATVTAMAVLSASVIRRRWFACLVVCTTLLICYSRIYLAKHFPMDIAWGALLGALLGWGAYRLFRLLARRWRIGGA